MALLLLYSSFALVDLALALIISDAYSGSIIAMLCMVVLFWCCSGFFVFVSGD